ncbi:methyl-accepting chemotaxis protein [Novosphingobium nitrogenifigens DSM 19370]|uniref:Methyl-accepting chemotaxis protein n=1 Tax=Novosphingobium nitrogenifigens DSM 19370 TaxID=983920 RepID=F1Z3U3_9SPHN|nr:hypothetical protein [Novosphingobium nitrogenifigens]EGD60733.1 methyl-accepting chemotaxis protein [Novosphingobium nitrogenifigens DSM 19370]
MRHETFPDTTHFIPPSALGEGVTAQARAGLAGIVERLDSHFMPAGLTLARLVETMGAVLGGLDAVTRAFGHGAEGTDAADNLLSAARRLSEAPDRQAGRAVQIAAMLDITRKLSATSSEIGRVLTVLQFYAVNLKIAAAGADEFIEFAGDMSVKLATGGKEVDLFKREVATMLASLSEMRSVDEVLARECARVVPAVPDRLAVEVGQLRKRQKNLTDVSRNAREIVLRLQGGVGRALGAIQIGDIARQRLEHVLDACRVFDEVMAHPETRDPAGTRGHMLHLFAAQLDDLTHEFSDQTGELLSALDVLAPDCDTLLDQGGRHGTVQDSGLFLRDLDECITGAHGMTRQLHRADEKAAEIADVVLRMAATLRERVQVIEELRFEVDYMAINVNIRARRDAAIGKPVAVISDEIRVCSQQLADLTLAISEVADELGQVSQGFEAQRAGADEPDVDETLSAALSIIRDGSRQAETAMSGLDTSAQDIVAMIHGAVDELSICGTLTRNLQSLTRTFTDMADAGEPMIEDCIDHPVVAMMDTMGRSYTMASERVVHDRFLLPGMEPLCKAPAASAFDAGSDEDDDDFGDVFL